MRITEPRVKLAYVLWLIEKGARDIKVKVDGAEPEREIISKELIVRGYSRQPIKKSKVSYTGYFSKNDITVTILGRPGIDIEARLPDGNILVAECKGEPTPAGIKSGTDLTAFYTALGQLLVTADNVEGKQPDYIALVIPDSTRLKEMVNRTAQNRRIMKLGIGIAVVSEDGVVVEITPNLR